MTHEEVRDMGDDELIEELGRSTRLVGFHEGRIEAIHEELDRRPNIDL